MHKIQKQIHEKALKIANIYKRSEAELLGVIQEADQHKVYRALGYSSLYTYCTGALGLSEAITYNFTTVARKAVEVPELREAVESGRLSISGARKITPVISAENKTAWIKKAETLPQKSLEREVARENPKAAFPDRVTYSNYERVNVNVNLSQEAMERVRRVQELLVEKKGRPVSLEEVLDSMSQLFLDKNDPNNKAKRAIVRKGYPKTQEKKPVSRQVLGGDAQGAKRQPIPAAIIHAVRVRDKGSCTARDPKTGKRCGSKRFLNIHHIKPVSQKGTNSPDNLTLICNGHHKALHEYGHEYGDG